MISGFDLGVPTRPESIREFSQNPSEAMLQFCSPSIGRPEGVLWNVVFAIVVENLQQELLFHTLPKPQAFFGRVNLKKFLFRASLIFKS